MTMLRSDLEHLVSGRRTLGGDDLAANALRDWLEAEGLFDTAQSLGLSALFPELSFPVQGAARYLFGGIRYFKGGLLAAPHAGGDFGALPRDRSDDRLIESIHDWPGTALQTREGRENVSSLVNLKSLSINSARFTDFEFNALLENPIAQSLRRLRILENSIFFSHRCQALKTNRLPNLLEFHLNAGCLSLSGTHRLLDFPFCHGVERLSVARGVRCLTFCQKLAKSTHLKNLRQIDLDIQPLALHDIKILCNWDRWSQLTGLGITLRNSDCNQSLELISESLPSLECLKLRVHGSYGRGLEHLKGCLPRLSKLEIQCFGIGPEAAKIFSGEFAPRLESLTLRDCQINPLVEIEVGEKLVPHLAFLSISEGARQTDIRPFFENGATRLIGLNFGNTPPHAIGEMAWLSMDKFPNLLRVDGLAFFINQELKAKRDSMSELNLI